MPTAQAIAESAQEPENNHALVAMPIAEACKNGILAMVRAAKGR
jgi:hypothetical protein